MRTPHIFAILLAPGGVIALGVTQSEAQQAVAIMEPDEARTQLDQASKAQARAQARAEEFGKQAEQATEAADKTAREAAALAARIQESEAQMTAARARYSLAQQARARLARSLATRREPLVRLTAALQTSARRPLALSALQPGSLKDLVYVRAMLDSAVPQIRARTATLRSELEEGRTLERRARRALTALRESERDLRVRRTELTAMEARQRVASQQARAVAAREEERALALAEEARDLDGLIGKLDANAQLRRELAALPGPVLRPADLSAEAPVVASDPQPASPDPVPQSAAAPGDFQLPVQGRTVTGFGETLSSGLRAKGIALSPAAGAQVVVPASGRVAFSGPYEGFGRIVIIEHAGGWTSAVTGLARVDVAVGDIVIGGGPLGIAGEPDELIAIELRRSGDPVNPLDYI